MSDWQEHLSTIPIFSFLKDSELERLNELFTEVVFEKGETVCRFGEEGDTFYVVLSGELEVWGGEDQERRTGILEPRDYFGEMALLQGGKRTATVTAARRSHLLALGKSSFDEIFLQNPQAIEYFARVLCKRLGQVTRGQSLHRMTTVISVTKRKRELKGVSSLSRAVSALLREIAGGEVLLIQVDPEGDRADSLSAHLVKDDFTKIPDRIRKEIVSAHEGPAILYLAIPPDRSKKFYEEKFSNLISKLSAHFRHMVFDFGAWVPNLNSAAAEFADQWIEIISTPEEHPTRNESRTRLFKVINLYNPESRQIPVSACEPFVLPKDHALTNQTVVEHILADPKSAYGRPVYRLVRKLLGATVGIALGGGAAFGVSHLGVLKVLEENEIPIDLIAGCSQGSIIGIGYAAGVPVDEMIRLARNLGQRKNFFMAMDFTLTGRGLLAGNRIVEVFAPYLGDKESFEQLMLPCRAMATDIETGESIAIGSGRLDRAFRASSSVPMVFSPVREGERVLVDGGVSDPVPAGAVRKMGADLCIAVNVVPPLKKGVSTLMEKTYRSLSWMNPLTYLDSEADLPDMLDLVMSSLQVLQYELGRFTALSADTVIQPDLSDYTWIEYYRSDEIIRKGIEAAERSLPAIEKSLKEKISQDRREE